jgi:succinate dehydrogenase / fumarate reductase, membrane anchor subunit
MVKSVLSVKHQGLTDWVIQRSTAIIMAIYSVGLIGYLLANSGLSFVEWRFLFSHTWMKIATILFIASVLYHAWIGMWTIFTDYVKLPILRCVLDFIVLLMLFACFIWGILIVWSV